MQGCGQVSCGAWALLTAPLCPQRPTDEEGFLQPPGERSSENYQIVKGVSGWLSGVGPRPSALEAPAVSSSSSSRSAGL